MQDFCPLKIKITQCSGGFRLEMFRKDAPYASIILTYKTFRDNDKKTFCFREFFIKQVCYRGNFFNGRFTKGVLFLSKMA